jgi:hypothetical protein
MQTTVNLGKGRRLSGRFMNVSSRGETVGDETSSCWIAGTRAMAKFSARLMDGNTGGEGAYRFEASDDLMDLPVDEIVDLFFTSASARVLTENVAWELNSAMRNSDRNIVTAMGSLLHAEDPPVPFLLLISEDRT